MTSRVPSCRAVPPGAVGYVVPVGVHGGAERVLLTVAARLGEHGGRGVWYSMRPGPVAAAAAAAGIPVRQFADHRFRDLHRVAAGAAWLARQFRRDGVDLVHASHGAHLYAWPAARLAGVPEVWHVHDYPYRFDPFEAVCRRLPADHTIFTTARVRSGHPLQRRRPHSIIEPWCLPDNAPAAAADDPALDPLPVRGRAFLLTVARLQEHKGHRVLLEALPAIVAAHPDVSWVVVGAAADPTQEAYRRTLGQRAADLGLTDRVLVLGRVDDATLARLYARARAVVHPATTEGFGLSVLEAMAAGAPVVAADADGPASIIGRSGAGLLAPRGDPVALAAAVCRVLADDALRWSLAERGRAFAADRTAGRMVRATVDVYRRTSARWAARRHGRVR